MKSLARIVSFVFNEFTNDIRVLKQNASLAKDGFEATVVATSARGLPWNEKSPNGYAVRRIWIPGIAFLPLQLIFWWLQCVWIYRRERILHCNDLYALPIGAAIKWLFNPDAKVVYDCHEHETEAHVYIGKPILKFIAKVVERVLIRAADEVICVSRPIAEAYEKNYGIPRPHLVMNCPELVIEPRKDLFREAFGIAPSTKILLFQGEYRRGRGIEILIEGFSRFQDPRVACVFIGYGPETAMVQEAASRLPNVFMHPTVRSGRHMDYVRSADIGVHLMENTCLNHYYALPNKLFEYAMAGIPVLVSNMLEMARLTREYEIGYVLERNDPEALVEQLKLIAEADLGAFAARVDRFRHVFNWSSEEKKFLEIYRRLAAGNVA